MLVRTDGDHGAGRGAVARAMSASAGPRPLRSDVAAQRVGRPLSRYGAPVSAEDEAAAHIGEVRRFYDRNTARFTGLGQGGASIHRAVYGPGVRSQAEAFHHVERFAAASRPGSWTWAAGSAAACFISLGAVPISSPRG